MRQRRRMMKAIGTLWALCTAAAAAASDAGGPSLREEATPRDRHRLRCNRRSEQVCVRCAYAADGTPTPEPYCANIADECPPAVCCDVATEEACHDPLTGEATHCAKLEEGGCPCPEGEEKCGVSQYSSGYCSKLCCDPTTEKTCYDLSGEPLLCVQDRERCPKRTRGRRRERCNLETEQVCTRCAYGEDGTPMRERYCADKSTECPEQVCCDVQTEETCYDSVTGYATSCAKLEEGGCPCPEGEEKCGVGQYSSGYCTSLCCDWSSEETCYDDEWNPVQCVKRGEGCPSIFHSKSQMVRVDYSDGEGAGGADGEGAWLDKRPFSRGRSATRCNPETERTCTKCSYLADGTPFLQHYCINESDECPGLVCCDIKTEETCHDVITGHASHCAKLDEGGCPCPEGEEKCGANEVSTGYCSKLCCDPETEETCYDENDEPIFCRQTGDKPCPKRKGSPPESSDTVRCDPETEETCFDGHRRPIFCRKEGDHPCPKPFLPPPALDNGTREQMVRVNYSDNRDAEDFNEPT